MWNLPASPGEGQASRGLVRLAPLRTLEAQEVWERLKIMSGGLNNQGGTERPWLRGRAAERKRGALEVLSPLPS